MIRAGAASSTPVAQCPGLHAERLAPGAVLLRGLAREHDADLLADLEAVVAAAPRAIR